MKKITTSTTVFGPYDNVDRLSDRWIVDGAELPFSVIGEGILGLATSDDFPPVLKIIDPSIVQSEIVKAVQLRLDTFAQSRNYDSILSASTYATSAIPKFAQEGQAAVNARDATWATLYTILGEVQSGTRPMPTGYSDIQSELPELSWS